MINNQNKKIKVVSLFDGIGCAYESLKRIGYTDIKYYASEIDKYALQVAKKQHPDAIALGSVKDVRADPVQNEPQYLFTKETSLHTGGIDLLIGGSPCQDLSIAKNDRKGLEGERSGLFWEYVRILGEVKPKYFVLENVASMSKKDKDIITETLGVEPVMINAALVSAQNRKRLFWVGKLRKIDMTNLLPVYDTVEIDQPEDREIYLKDILVDGWTEDEMKSLCITATYYKKNARDYLKKRSGQMVRIGDIGSNAQAHRVYSPEGKSVTLSAHGGGQGAKTGLYMVQRPRGKNKGGEHHEKSPTLTSSSFEHNNHVTDGEDLRKLHPIECERLQGLPDNFTEKGIDEHGNEVNISNTQRYIMLGNAFNVDVVAHILEKML